MNDTNENGNNHPDQVNPVEAAKIAARMQRMALEADKKAKLAASRHEVDAEAIKARQRAADAEFRRAQREGNPFRALAKLRGATQHAVSA